MDMSSGPRFSERELHWMSGFVGLVMCQVIVAQLDRNVIERPIRRPLEGAVLASCWNVATECGLHLEISELASGGVITIDLASVQHTLPREDIAIIVELPARRSHVQHTAHEYHSCFQPFFPAKVGRLRYLSTINRATSS
jgi:hypothetical protein